ncbi:TM2 domain-containing protein [Croceibacterium sp. LX-88]|uniref:TM2 domain-containing protein n=1 Tax=Croceibacterium selenioxidans TaxID=2838833 RepID=A0ABS5W3E7_9SPHN|nr:TM2 domain-containing protein [Croceibacterium selenioxidans]MBT2134219.1 TM2 domain-containing protein [Croceibacterium selenioxidans]
MSGFGRKGLGVEGAAATAASVGLGLDGLHNSARRHGSFGSLAGLPSGDPDLARRREAFLASERARKAEAGDDHSNEGGAFKGKPTGDRSLPMAYLLWFILGNLSAHRFYLGAYQSAVIQFFVGVFSWMLIFTSATTGDGGFGIAGFAVLVGWGLWVLGDVFFIHRLYKRRYRRPSEVAATFA